jgi:hypothetical protein
VGSRKTIDRLFEGPKGLGGLTTRYARWVVKQTVGNHDGLGRYRVASAMIPARIIAEAWSPERKAAITDTQRLLGNHLVDHLVVGDYDLCLWHTKEIEEHPHLYTVSINNAEHDPNDPTTQTQRVNVRGGYRSPRREIVNKLMTWVGDYGTLVVGSVLPERNATYLKILQRWLPGYRFSPWYHGDPRYGFKIEAPIVLPEAPADVRTK